MVFIGVASDFKSSAQWRSETRVQLQSRGSTLHRSVPCTTFPDRQTVVSSAFRSGNSSIREQFPSMRSGGVRLAVINESNGSVLTTETRSRGLQWRVPFPSFPPAPYSITAGKEGFRRFEKTGSEPTSERLSSDNGVELSMNRRNIVLSVTGAMVAARWKGSQRLAVSESKLPCSFH